MLLLGYYLAAKSLVIHEYSYLDILRKLIQELFDPRLYSMLHIPESVEAKLISGRQMIG